MESSRSSAMETEVRPMPAFAVRGCPVTPREGGAIGGGGGGKESSRSSAMGTEIRSVQAFAVRGCPITPQEERRARLVEEAKAAWKKKLAFLVAEAKATREKRLAGEDSEEDYEDPCVAAEAAKFKDTWNSVYSRYIGCFEDTTKIPNKRFTFEKPGPQHIARPRNTLQIFSLKVARMRRGLQWPLHVFGMVAVRDVVDRRRNMIFDRPRHNCQILTQEAPYLKLTGPMRAVVVLDPVTFEVDLKVKGATESEDKHLSFLAVTYIDFASLESCLFKRDYTSKLSTLEFELGSIVNSVEATITVEIRSGSWPDGFRAQFAASTASIGDTEIILLDSRDDKVPVDACSGNIMLSRRVVSVEAKGQLILSVKALQGGEILVHTRKAFNAKKARTSDATLDVGFCTMDISIAWSLISSN